MYDEVVNNTLAALKLIPNWFVTSKMIKKLDTALEEDDGLLFFFMKILVMSHFVVTKWVFSV